MEGSARGGGREGDEAEGRRDVLEDGLDAERGFPGNDPQVAAIEVQVQSIKTQFASDESQSAANEPQLSGRETLRADNQAS